MLIALLAFIAEYVDSALGMGYGTILAPLLLIAGYEPAQIVPSILMSELVTGLFSGLLHWKVGNSRLDRHNLKMLGLLGGVTVVGTSIGAMVMINLPAVAVKGYMAVLVIAMGILMLVKQRQRRFSWKGITGISFLAAFNKAISGGGYGPVVCSGQILSGVHVKQAVGLTGLAEGLACAVGILVYSLGIGRLDLALAPWLLIGSLAGVPLAVLTVKRLKVQKLRRLVAVGVLLLGLWIGYSML